MASKHIWVLYEASIDFMCKLEANMASSKVKGRGGMFVIGVTLLTGSV